MLSNILILKLAVLYQLLLNGSRIMVLALEYVEEPPCRSKYQIGLESPSDVTIEAFEPIEFEDFDKVPSETMLENDSQVLLVHLKFNDSVPTVKVNFEQTLGVRGTFRLQFLYFQGFNKVPSLAYENVRFPGELHALFYNVNAKSFEQSLVTDNDIIILAFQVEVNHLETLSFDVLQENLKHVQDYDTTTLIPNQNLEYWMEAEMQKFYTYEGTFRYNCEGKVIYIDFTDVLFMSPEIVIELQMLKAHNLNDTPPTDKPKGKVYTNVPPLPQIISSPPLSLFHNDDPTNGTAGEMPGISMQVCVLFVVYSLLLNFY